MQETPFLTPVISIGYDTAPMACPLLCLCREVTAMELRTENPMVVETPCEEQYEVTCLGCGERFDACQAAWCDCITDNPTLVCPECGHCFCDQDVEVRKNFWSKAPASLWRRRLQRGFRGEAEPPLPEGNPLRRPLILVVDDEHDTRLIAFRVLQSLGYGVVMAKNGLEAIHMTKAYRPDLVLTDQMMPGLDGKHLCKALKEDAETRDVPIILMTGLYKRESQRIEILKDFKANDFLTKPIAFNRLGEVVGGWLEAPSVH